MDAGSIPASSTPFYKSRLIFWVGFFTFKRNQRKYFCCTQRELHLALSAKQLAVRARNIGLVGFFVWACPFLLRKGSGSRPSLCSGKSKKHI